MGSTKFNIYYATSLQGPWTLSNPVPLDRVEGLQSYTVTGLRQETLYYFSIVGGILDSQNNFVPLIFQPIGPNQTGAADQQVRPVFPIGAQTFSPSVATEDSLDMSFVFGTVDFSFMDMEFEVL